jgi:hypothetical protein
LLATTSSKAIIRITKVIVVVAKAVAKAIEDKEVESS